MWMEVGKMEMKWTELGKSMGAGGGGVFILVCLI